MSVQEIAPRSLRYADCISSRMKQLHTETL
jgi:hypothetical protein